MPIVPFVLALSRIIPASDTPLARCGVARAFPAPWPLISHERLPAYSSFLTGKYRRVTADWLVGLLNVTPKALCAYWEKGEGPDTAKREQALQLTRVLELGREVFKEATSFNSWLRKPAYGLAGKFPVDLFYVSGGIDLVIDELTRIACGDLA
jgi:hypothetical protein